MLALVDADILVHRVGFTTENEEEHIAKARFDEMMDGILNGTKSLEYRLYLSDSTSNNFRIQFYPEYKANRKQPKPKHYDALKLYAIKEWGATVTCNQEADDALGIDQWAYWGGYTNGVHLSSTICSIDKDLFQIPGLHYNFVTGESREVSPVDGLRHFYYQLLKGDSSDNIQGCPGIGEKKAWETLGDLTDENDLFQTVLKKYKEQYEKKIYKRTLSRADELFVLEQLYKNGVCLKIRTREDEIWEPDALLMAVIQSESTLPTVVHDSPSTELISAKSSSMSGSSVCGTEKAVSSDAK